MIEADDSTTDLGLTSSEREPEVTTYDLQLPVDLKMAQQEYGNATSGQYREA